jgi:uncharacterized membrane protein YfcA
MLLYLMLAGFACLAGVTTVLFGFGGGFVVVPLLYRTLIAHYGAESAIGGMAMHIAVATSTCVMIVTAVLATRRHARKGNILWPQVWPLAACIGVGAVVGAAAATLANGEFVRWAFVVYLGVSILDCVARKGFMAQAEDKTPQAPGAVITAIVGVVIGVVATFLGVGGSVMTVPMMRRRGLDMTRATAMANPLTVPVALAGTATYMLTAWHQPVPLSAWHVGYVDLAAFAVLTCGSLVGVQAATPFIGRIPDRLHAQIYVGLLSLVLISMAI